MGGLLLFALAIIVFFVMRALYKPHALLGEKHQSRKKSCEDAGGTYIADPEDPCCKNPGPSFPYKKNICGGGPPSRSKCPEACLNDPNSGFCVNNPNCFFEV